MSYTSEIKDEIFENPTVSTHCRLAELSAYINTLCVADTSAREMLFVCDDKRNADRIKKLIGDLFGYEYTPEKIRETYVIRIDEGEAVMRILSLAGSFSRFENDSSINPSLIKRNCCKGAYLRTAFLVNGFVTDPSKNYHMEFSEKEYAHAYGLKQLMAGLGIYAGITERKNRFVVYIKDSEQISDLLRIMSAPLSLLKFENIKIYKEVRNNINRKINCEMSNMQKTISASVREKNAIELLIKKDRYRELSPKLKETAELRLENPDLSYQELGALLNPPLGKSGVYHRLQKIIKESLRD